MYIPRMVYKGVCNDKGEEENPIAPCKFIRKKRVNQEKDLLLHCNMIFEYLKYILFRSFETTVIFLCMY